MVQVLVVKNGEGSSFVFCGNYMTAQVCVYTGFMLKVKVETMSSLYSVQWHHEIFTDEIPTLIHCQSEVKLGQNCTCERTVEDITLFYSYSMM